MKIMLIDDEPLALVHLRQLLLSISSGVEIAASCTDVHEALAAAPTLRPDLIFIDIMMPEINGLDAAERLQGILPDTQIVFVTAHDDFAIRAFELNAIDYVLKPPEAERLRNTLARIRLPAASAAPEAAAEAAPSAPEPESRQHSHRPVIRCFRRLQLGESVLPWRTNKSRELFAYLLHRRKEIVRKDALIEIMWPEFDFKKAFTYLYTSTYNVRKMLYSLELDVTLESTETGYFLDLRELEVDVDQWERALQSAPPLSVDTVEEHIQIFYMYQGDYLGEYDYLWAESERERLRTLWYQHALKLSSVLGSTNLLEPSINVNQRILEFFPYCEEAYWQLMKISESIGDLAAVHRAYKQLSEVLQIELGTQPSEAIRAWYYERC